MSTSEWRRRRLFEGFNHDGLDRIVPDLARCSRTGFVVEALEPQRQKPRAPLRHGAEGNAQFLGHSGVASTARTRQDNATSKGQGLSARWSPRPPFSVVRSSSVNSNGSRIGLGMASPIVAYDDKNAKLEQKFPTHELFMTQVTRHF